MKKWVMILLAALVAAGLYSKDKFCATYPTHKICSVPVPEPTPEPTQTPIPVPTPTPTQCQPLLRPLLRMLASR